MQLPETTDDEMAVSRWWVGFQKWHAILAIAHARVIASHSDVLERYYDMLEAILWDNGLLESPSSIFNCDKTGMPLIPGPSKIVATREQNIHTPKGVRCVHSLLVSPGWHP